MPHSLHNTHSSLYYSKLLLYSSFPWAVRRTNNFFRHEMGRVSYLFRRDREINLFTPFRPNPIPSHPRKIAGGNITQDPRLDPRLSDFRRLTWRAQHAPITREEKTHLAFSAFSEGRLPVSSTWGLPSLTLSFPCPQPRLLFCRSLSLRSSFGFDPRR